MAKSEEEPENAHSRRAVFRSLWKRRRRRWPRNRQIHSPYVEQTNVNCCHLANPLRKNPRQALTTSHMKNIFWQLGHRLQEKMFRKEFYVGELISLNRDKY